jgi:hypothetical protein
MSLRTIAAAAGAFMLMTAAPANAQERGTIEFGAFGNYSNYDDDLRMDNGWGGGARVGAFIFPRLSVEFEGGRKKALRPLGLGNLDVEPFVARLLAAPLELGPLGLLLGAGITHTDWKTDESDGFQALVGLKFGLGSLAVLRADAVMDFNDNKRRNKAIQVGLSFYRHPGGRVAPAVTTLTRVDTVRSVRVDTVRAAAAAPALPTGQATTICLATGENVQVLVTAQGDTLVGASRTSVRTLRQGGVAFAGEYAEGRSWMERDEPIVFEGRSLRKSGGEMRLNCPDLQRVGEYQGVPLFVTRGAATPYTQLYVPVRPGVWQTYENLRATRG